MVYGKIRQKGNVSVANTRLALKNRAPFTKCNLEINDEHVDTAENLDIVMPMYHLTEYSDNYQDSSATLYQYKRDEPPDNIGDNLTTANSSSLKYKVNLLGDPVTIINADNANNNVSTLNVKVVVPLKYLSNFFRSLEMPLINCKIKLNLTWKRECTLSTNPIAVNNDVTTNQAIFIINDTKLYVQLLLCQKKIIKILLSNKIKVFEDLFIGMNIKQKNKLKMLMLMPLNILI